MPVGPGWHHEPVVDLQPFTALRPLPHLAHRVAAPPYDVVDAEQAAAMIHTSPDSFLRVTRPDADPWLDDSRPNARSERNGTGDAQRGLRGAARARPARGPRARGGAGVLGVPAAGRPWCRGTGHVQTGVVGLASVADYEAGVIKVHEHTRPDKEDERAHHVDVLDAHDEPVFLFHAGSDPLDAAVAEVTAAEHDLAVTTPDGVWPRCGGCRTAPRRRGSTTRSRRSGRSTWPTATTAPPLPSACTRPASRRRRGEAGETGGFLAVVFPAAELTVLPYQRLVTDLGGLTPQALLARLEPEFDVEPGTGPVLPDDRTTIGLRTEAGWHRLRLRAQAPPAGGVQGLAVSLLQDRVLAPLLGITDPRRDPRLAFAGGPEALADLDDAVTAGRARAGFTLAPTTVGELVAVSDRGEVMPPKSTWFHPKPASGLLVHPLH